jgi:hypothetical protein
MPLFSSLRAATANHNAARRLAPRWKLIDAARASNNADEGSSALRSLQFGWVSSHQRLEAYQACSPSQPSLTLDLCEGLNADFPSYRIHHRSELR